MALKPFQPALASKPKPREARGEKKSNLSPPGPQISLSKGWCSLLLTEPWELVFSPLKAAIS